MEEETRFVDPIARNDTQPIQPPADVSPSQPDVLASPQAIAKSVNRQYGIFSILNIFFYFWFLFGLFLAYIGLTDDNEWFRGFMVLFIGIPGLLAAALSLFGVLSKSQRKKRTIAIILAVFFVYLVLVYLISPSQPRNG